MARSVRTPNWAGCALRIIPGSFPQSFTYQAESDQNEVRVTLSERGAVLDKILNKSGLPISMALPANNFKGVAARAIDDGHGHSTVTLELHHSDPDLCIPLLVDSELDNIAQDWRNWSETYNIPMLMVEADGVARPLDENMAQQNVDPSGQSSQSGKSYHRRNQGIAHRRPRFLMRRKPGNLGCRMRISGREIIARR